MDEKGIGERCVVMRVDAMSCKFDVINPLCNSIHLKLHLKIHHVHFNEGMFCVTHGVVLASVELSPCYLFFFNEC